MNDKTNPDMTLEDYFSNNDYRFYISCDGIERFSINADLINDYDKLNKECIRRGIRNKEVTVTIKDRQSRKIEDRKKYYVYSENTGSGNNTLLGGDLGTVFNLINDAREQERVQQREITTLMLKMMKQKNDNRNDYEDEEDEGNWLEQIGYTLQQGNDLLSKFGIGGNNNDNDNKQIESKEKKKEANNFIDSI